MICLQASVFLTDSGTHFHTVALRGAVGSSSLHANAGAAGLTSLVAGKHSCNLLTCRKGIRSSNITAEDKAWQFANLTIHGWKKRKQRQSATNLVQSSGNKKSQ
jgi:hypothetical protein